MAAGPFAPPPPLVTPAARRVAVGLFVFGFLVLLDLPFALVAVFKSGGIVPFPFPFGFLLLWGIGYLFWRGHQFLWAPLAYLTATSLGAVGAALSACAVALPWKLVLALLRHPNLWIAGHLFYVGSALILIAWFYGESQHVLSASPPLVRSGWLKPGAFAAYSALLSVTFVAVLLGVMQGSWTGRAKAEARNIYGDSYDYFVLSFNAQYRNGVMFERATVLAFNEDELERVTVEWEQ
jgi:hypothetical protein